MPEGVPLLLAFASGSVSTLNPCGFAMLPAFIGIFLAERERGSVRVEQRLLRAIVVAATVTLGFVAVFVALGALIVTGAALVVDLIPWIALLVGVALVVVGGVILAGRSISVPVHPVGGGSVGGVRAMVVYGAGYALASVGCTLPVFLVVVGSALATSGVVAGITVFFAYAVGMGTVLLAVSVATALGKGVLVRRFHRVLPHVERLGAVGLMLAGGYLVYREVAFLRFLWSF